MIARIYRKIKHRWNMKFNKEYRAMFFRYLDYMSKLTGSEPKK